VKTSSQACLRVTQTKRDKYTNHAGIILVLKENTELLQETASDNETEKDVVGALILCVNITAAFLYLAYRILKAGSSLFKLDRYYEGCKRVYVYLVGAPPQHKVRPRDMQTRLKYMEKRPRYTINYSCSLTGVCISDNYFTCRSVQIFKMLFQGFYDPESDPPNKIM